MKSIHATLIKHEDGSVVLRDAEHLPPGEYQVTVQVAEEDFEAWSTARRKAYEEFLESVKIDLGPLPAGYTGQREIDEWGRQI